MTEDALAVVTCIFSNIWRLFNSWYIPGTNVTPAVAMFGCLFVFIVFRWVGPFFGLGVDTDFRLREHDKK